MHVLQLIFFLAASTNDDFLLHRWPLVINGLSVIDSLLLKRLVLDRRSLLINCLSLIDGPSVTAYKIDRSSRFYRPVYEDTRLSWPFFLRRRGTFKAYSAPQKSMDFGQICSD
jgi:hypothetical protein